MKYIMRVMSIFFGCFVIISMAISIRTSLNTIGDPALELITYWSAINNCNEIHAITPADWMPIAQGIVEPGDCVLSVSGYSYNSPEMINHLKDKLELDYANRFVPVEIRRDQAQFTVFLPVTKISINHILQIYLAIILTAALLWILGSIVLIVNPDQENNIVFTYILWFIALAITSIRHKVPDFGEYLTLFATVIPLALLGGSFFHLGYIFPVKIERYHWLKYALYIPSLFGIALYTYVIVNIASGKSNIPTISNQANYIIASIFIIGFSFTLIRWAYLWIKYRHQTKSKILLQVKIAYTTWLVGGLFNVILMIVYQEFNLKLPIIGKSIFFGLFLLVIPAAGTAFTILRYESTHAKRSFYLDLLMIILISAVIVDISILVNSYIEINGIIFINIFFVAVVTSIFWYIDNPFRRIFEKYFLRHQNDAEILFGLVNQLDITKDIQGTIYNSLIYLTNQLEVESIYFTIEKNTIKTSEHFYIMENEPINLSFEHNYDTISFSKSPNRSYKHQEVVYDNNNNQIGYLYLGSKITNEDFDAKDYELIRLITQYLSWFVLAKNQLILINQIIQRIIKARDSIFGDINHVIHDNILGKLNSVTFGIDMICEFDQLTAETKARLLQYKASTDQTVEILKRFIIQKQIAIPGVKKNFLPEIYRLIYELIQDQQPKLHWEMPSRDDMHYWDILSIDKKRDIYRVIHAAVTNTIAYAQARNINIIFGKKLSMLSLSIIDDGIGFEIDKDIKQNSTGLMTMFERTKNINGYVEIHSAINQGTTIELLIPIEIDIPTLIYEQSTEQVTQLTKKPKIELLNSDIQIKEQPKKYNLALICMAFMLGIGVTFILKTDLLSLEKVASQPKVWFDVDVRFEAQRDAEGNPWSIQLSDKNGIIHNYDTIATGTTVTMTFVLRNHKKDKLATLQRLVVAARGPGVIEKEWNAPTMDFPAFDNVVIEPYKTYTFTASKVYDQPGDYFLEPLFQDEAGDWRSIADPTRITFFVADLTNPIISEVVEVAADRDWKYTPIYIQPGDTIEFIAQKGSWTTDMNSLPFVNAAGYQNLQYDWTRLPSANYGQLIGSIGDWKFAIGNQATIQVPSYQGILRLGINDAHCTDVCLSDNRGSITVAIVVRRAKK